MEKADCKKPVKRLWISSMEEGAIRKGFENLKDGKDYDSLYRSALCRAKADWLVGINATRLFSLLYNHTLNVGRVQSPTLKMLVDRNEAITNFKKEKYYHVRLALGDAEAVSEKFSDKEEAEKVAKACKGKSTVCTSLTSEKRKHCRRSSLTLPHFKRKRTAFSVIPQSRPLTLRRACMKRSF